MFSSLVFSTFYMHSLHSSQSCSLSATSLRSLRHLRRQPGQACSKTLRSQYKSMKSQRTTIPWWSMVPWCQNALLALSCARTVDPCLEHVPFDLYWDLFSWHSAEESDKDVRAVSLDWRQLFPARSGANSIDSRRPALTAWFWFCVNGPGETLQTPWSFGKDMQHINNDIFSPQRSQRIHSEPLVAHVALSLQCPVVRT